MYRTEVDERSPLRVFDRSVHGGLGPGNLGVVLARAGVGKTPFLAQIGLGELLADRKVLHVSASTSVAEVRQCYDALVLDLLGYNKVSVYDASLSEWAADEQLPMETG